jgi:hypothetical protein
MLDSKCNPLPVTGEAAKPGKVDSQRSPATPLDRKSIETSQMPGSQGTARSAQKGTRYVLAISDFIGGEDLQHALSYVDGWVGTNILDAHKHYMFRVNSTWRQRATANCCCPPTGLQDFHCCTVHVALIISLIFQLMHTIYTTTL